MGLAFSTTVMPGGGGGGDDDDSEQEEEEEEEVMEMMELSCPCSDDEPSPVPDQTTKHKRGTIRQSRRRSTSATIAATPVVRGPRKAKVRAMQVIKATTALQVKRVPAKKKKKKTRGKGTWVGPVPIKREGLAPGTLDESVPPSSVY